ncbi:DUF6670 family protein [Nocardia mangyaensis]|uniref:DUF6670 family protein n=1 Tax=Nocardia mangyaensis TaxID=2213200 RepID=UPI002675F818|nr:DUF6670 family protein [Nocardia mangyaensis]MDO3645863.1 hypothetical protein [Nocardia mangyaensis]
MTPKSARGHQPVPVVYDPDRRLGWFKDMVSRVAPHLFGVVPPDFPTDTALPTFTPPSKSRFGQGVAHYGIMIPDLPAPHHFMANMTMVGYTGFRAWDVDFARQGRARDTATVGHGTAATTHDPFTAHGSHDSAFAPDGSSLRFGPDYTISGTYPDFRLRSMRPGFETDLEFTATGDVTWFTKRPYYTHVGLLSRYRGTITHGGEPTVVTGLCSVEYGKGHTPTMILNRPVPTKLKAPFDFFTYHVLNLDADSQLLLVGTGMGDTPLVMLAFERTVGGGSWRLGTSVRFEVIEFQNEPFVGPDGESMAMPASFRWTIRDGNQTLTTLDGTVDTQWLYAGVNIVAGYTYTARHKGRQIGGRGYVEYSDRRP